jgi:lipid II:glycine glycyltransferase (peptidoglycan interpeptide bridge formation enzyme)
LTYIGHVLDLSQSQGQVFSNFRDSTRRNVKKAMKEGVEVKLDRSLESVKEFCRLNCMTRKEHGLPPQPFHFFKKIYDHVISKNLGMVVLASLNQENVAGAIYFHFGMKAVFKYGASDKKFQNLRANNLVMWEAMRWYSQNGYKSLCLGRTEFENQGLIQFKSGWGTTEQPIHYYQYDFKKGSFVRGSSKVTGFHNKIFRNIPIPISNKIGALLYKHVG